MLKEFSLSPIFGVSNIKNIYNTKTFSQANGAKIVAAFLIVLNLVLLFSYIFGVNFRASAGYEIKSLQNKINNLSQENKKLNLNIAEKSSVNNLETVLSQQGFSPVKSAIYLENETGLTMR